MTTYKIVSLWLLAGLVIGAAGGAYLASEWKERQIEQRIEAAVQVERDRQEPLLAEREALRQALERERLQSALSGIAVEVERKNFGLALERLSRFREELQSHAEKTGSPDAETMQHILTRLEEITVDLEALDPRAATELHELFAELQKALTRE